MPRLDLASLRRRLSEHTPRTKPRDEETRLASVAVLLRYPQSVDGPEVLFIKRSRHPRDPWSGHMAFPGGRQEKSDADALAAAIRETREEVGLCLLQQGELLGRLDDCQAIARGGLINMVIAPFVFLVDEPALLRLQDGEVETAHWFPVMPLMVGSCDTQKNYPRGDEVFQLPAWQVGDEIVWGLTYTMMQSFLDVLRSAS